MLDIQKIRNDFPILKQKVYGKPLVYFDNAATSQTPECVVDTIRDGYDRINANVHRGVHFLSQEATEGAAIFACSTRLRNYFYSWNYRIYKPGRKLVRRRFSERRR